jgi:hypothetical protein
MLVAGIILNKAAKGPQTMTDNQCLLNHDFFDL